MTRHSIKPYVHIEEYRDKRGRLVSHRLRIEVNGRALPSIPCGPKREHAEQMAARIKTQLWEGRLNIQNADTTKTFADLAARFEADRPGDWTQRSWANHYGETIGDFKAFNKGDLPLVLVNADLLLRFKAWLEKQRPRKRGKVGPDGEPRLGLRPNVVAMRLSDLSSMLAYAVRPLRWMSENPMEDVPIPRYKPQGRVYEGDLLRLIVEHARPRAQAPMWILPHTGMRQGELINLHQQQVHRDQGFVRVMRHQRLGIDSDWDRKTRNAVDVPIAGHLWPYFGKPRATGYVFWGYSEKNPRVRSNQFSQDFHHARNAAAAWLRAQGREAEARSIEKLTAHHSKHTFASKYLESDGNKGTVALSNITGTSIATLERTYRHILRREPASEPERVDLGAPPPIARPKSPKKAR